MTLAAVWIETKTVGKRPLCFASDSRTTPGPLEGVTKVLLFGRQDIGGVWAGDYRYASLIAAHLDAFFTASDPMRRRDVDLARALARVRSAVLRHLSASVSASVPSWQKNAEAQLPERTVILIGGYSIVQARHLLLRVEWQPDRKRWKASVEPIVPEDLVVIGDDRDRARRVARQARQYRLPFSENDWRMEPLAAIHNACEDRNRRTIGGAVQLAKAYMHGSTRAYGVSDPSRGGVVSVRATEADARAIRELETAGMVVDLSTWRLQDGTYAGLRSD